MPTASPMPLIRSYCVVFEPLRLMISHLGYSCEVDIALIDWLTRKLYKKPEVDIPSKTK